MIFTQNNCLLHDPKLEFAGGKMRPYPESPQRIETILEELHNHEIDVLQAQEFEIEHVRKIHTDEYVEFLSSIPSDIEEIAPTAINKRGTIKKNSSFYAKLGHYFYDPATPIMSKTYDAAIASVNTSLSATRELLQGNVNCTYALGRPPGHHASSDQGGGYCLFNNVAIAAQYLVEKGKSVTILDLDYHHGNGTQSIFYNTDTVQYVSIHADPTINYPFYWGWKEELGKEEGDGYTVNYPIETLSTEVNYLEVLDQAIGDIEDYNPDVLLVSMGFDTYILDPVAGMQLSIDSYSEIGTRLQQFQKVGIVLEGGYHLGDLGRCFVSLYNGLSS